jgi:Dolichyl-phosphate-mannose-protein mannosyltransferase
LTDTPLTALSPVSLRRWILLFAITLGFMARMATFQVPLFDHHSWRQADGATIARNFYREGLTPLRPTIDGRGDSAEGTVATGLELHSLLFAAVSRVTGFSDMVGRVVSALCFPASVLLLWSFCRSRYGEDHALIAAVVYSLGLPLVVYAERSIWNEPVLLLLTMAALASAQAYSVDARPLHLLGLIVSLSLLGAVKPQWLIMLAPVWALWFERDGWQFLARWETWLVAIVPCATAAAFLWHMHEVAERTQLTFGAADKLFQLGDMTGHFVFVITRRMVRDIFGPIGVVAWIAGLVALVKRGRRVEIAALLACLVYLIVVSHGNRRHDYYQLAMVPAGVIAIPAGILAIAQWARERLPPAWTVQRIAGTLVWMMVVSCFVRSVSFHSWYEVDQDKLRFCSLLRPQLAAGELVVFADYTSPDVLYCLDRRGWLHQGPPMTVEQVRQRKDSGADVLVMPMSSAEALSGTGTPIARTNEWLAIRLGQ